MAEIITLRVGTSAIAVEIMDDEAARVDVLHVFELRSEAAGWASDIAAVARRYSGTALLTQDQRADTLRELIDIGQRIANKVLNGQTAVFRQAINQVPGADIRVVSSPGVWIPWELLYYAEEATSLEGFLGFRRNIYRVPTHQNRGLSISTRPKIGFFAHKRSPLAGREFDVLWEYEQSMQVTIREWPNLTRDTDMENWKALDILHFAGILSSVDYMDESHLYVDVDLYLKPQYFAAPAARFQFTAAPLVVFNARGSSNRNPYHVTEYARLLLECGAMGVIATEFPIPPILAEQFAEHLYRCLLDDGKPIDAALAETKKHLVEECNNPFGILYVPYFVPPLRSVTPITDAGQTGAQACTCDFLEFVSLFDDTLSPDDLDEIRIALYNQYPHPKFKSTGTLEGTNKRAKIRDVVTTLDSYGTGARASFCRLARIKMCLIQNNAFVKRFDDMCPQTSRWGSV